MRFRQIIRVDSVHRRPPATRSHDRFISRQPIQSRAGGRHNTQEEVLKTRLLKALEGVPVQFSLIIRVDAMDFSEEDVFPLADFVNEKVKGTKQEELPAQLEFGGAKITLRRYTVDVAPEPRIMVVTE